MTPLAALTLALALLTRGDFTVAEREASWDEMRARIFDVSWIVPRASRAELEASPRGTRDLVDDLRALLALRFEPMDVDDPLLRAEGFGDLVALFDARRADARATDALLERLRAERPDVWRRVGWALPELVREARFLSSRWDPDDDRRDDGFLIAAPRDLELSGLDPFRSASGSLRAVQVATLIRADLVAVKAAENDFRTWPDRIGADYESIRPVPGTHLRGVDPQGRPFAALRIRFTCDLPFPFGGYDCDLRMLHRLDEDGNLVSDVMSPGGEFYWLAGHDLFLPVLDSSGEWVAMLCVRVFGCDLQGVPDGVSHHEAGAREGLGNMKREAERRWSAAAERRPVYRDSVPEFTVHGPD